MSDLRPSGDDGDGAARLLASAHARLAAAAAELAVPEGLRLGEWHRRTLADLHRRLVRQIEDELRSDLSVRLPAHEALVAALSSAHVEIAAPILTRRGAAIDGPLLAILLRRAEEHRLHRATGMDNGLLLEFAGSADAALASEAMALLIAQSGRLDGFQEPLIAHRELPAEIEHQVVWDVAAALRRYAIEQHRLDPGEADNAIAAAASAVLSRHDEGTGFEARALRLCRKLEDSGLLDDTLFARTLTEGTLPLFLAAAATRADVDGTAAWEVLLDLQARGPVLLLRAAATSRVTAAALLLRLGADEVALARQLDLFDSTDEAEARRLLVLWQVDPGYRAAIARLAA